MKIKTFGPKEFNLVEILKNESKKSATTIVLRHIVKYHLILGKRTLDSLANTFLPFLITECPVGIDISIDLEMSNQRIPLFYVNLQNPNFKI